jgi:hypothetical protein
MSKDLERFYSKNRLKKESNGCQDDPRKHVKGIDRLRSWQQELEFDSLTPLISSKNQAIGYFSGRDLLGENMAPIESLWLGRLPSLQEIPRLNFKSGFAPI